MHFGGLLYQIAEKASSARSTVFSNLASLLQSTKLLVETEEGHALAPGVELSWSADGDVMSGNPTPEEVEKWSQEGLPAPAERDDGGDDRADSTDHEPEIPQKGHVYADNTDRHLGVHQPIGDRLIDGEA
jgi:hypothetical protein